MQLLQLMQGANVHFIEQARTRLERESKEFFNKAIDDYKKILSINPLLSEPYGQMGGIYSYDLYDPRIALQLYERAILLDPNNHYHYHGLACLEFEKLHNPEKAIELVFVALQKCVNRPYLQVLYNLLQFMYKSHYATQQHVLRQKLEELAVDKTWNELYFEKKYRSCLFNLRYKCKQNVVLIVTWLVLLHFFFSL